jgi:hypothetical protein
MSNPKPDEPTKAGVLRATMIALTILLGGTVLLAAAPPASAQLTLGQAATICWLGSNGSLARGVQCMTALGF